MTDQEIKMCEQSNLCGRMVSFSPPPGMKKMKIINGISSLGDVGTFYLRRGMAGCVKEIVNSILLVHFYGSNNEDHYVYLRPDEVEEVGIEWPDNRQSEELVRLRHAVHIQAAQIRDLLRMNLSLEHNLEESVQQWGADKADLDGQTQRCSILIDRLNKYSNSVAKAKKRLEFLARSADQSLTAGEKSLIAEILQVLTDSESAHLQVE